MSTTLSGVSSKTEYCVCAIPPYALSSFLHRADGFSDLCEKEERRSRVFSGIAVSTIPLHRAGKTLCNRCNVVAETQHLCGFQITQVFSGDGVMCIC